MAKLQDITSESVVSGPVIAELIMTSARRVEQLTALGVIPRQQRGKYHVGKSVAAYVEYLRDPAYRRDLAEKRSNVDLSE